MTDVTPRAEVLREAEKLITGDRNESYGTPTQNFENIAEMWSTRLRHKLRDDLTATDVADLMILLKVARNIANPKRDNYVDIAGYAGCGYETTLPHVDTPPLTISISPHGGTLGTQTINSQVQRSFGANPSS